MRTGLTANVVSQAWIGTPGTDTVTFLVRTDLSLLMFLVVVVVVVVVMVLVVAMMIMVMMMVMVMMVMMRAGGGLFRPLCEAGSARLGNRA